MVTIEDTKSQEEDKNLIVDKTPMLGIMNGRKKKKAHALTLEETPSHLLCLASSSSHFPQSQLLLKISPVISSDRIIFVRQQIISLDSFFLVALSFRSINLC